MAGSSDSVDSFAGDTDVRLIFALLRPPVNSSFTYCSFVIFSLLNSNNKKGLMSNWYRHYPGDYIRDTQFLTLEQHGAYRLLMDNYYSTGQPLPDDRFKLSRILMVSPLKTGQIMKELERFFDKKDGLLFHKKIEFELDKSLKLHETAVANGMAGGKATALARAQATKVPSKTKTSSIASNTTKHVGDEFSELDRQAWDKYIVYRVESKRKKLTPTGEKLAAKKLIKYGSNGKQMEVVEQTISNGWTGLFELSGGNNGKSKQTGRNIFDEGTAEAFAQVESEEIIKS